MIESELRTAGSTEARLRAEIELLKQRLDEQERLLAHSGLHTAEPHNAAGHPSRRTLWLLGILALSSIIGGFLVGYIPHTRQQLLLANEANADSQSIPTVNVVSVVRSSNKSELVLTGNIQAVVETPILARASGYIKRRTADIGDRVSAGQLLAEIDAAELDQQVTQAQAGLEQVSASLEQASADLAQGKTNEQLSRVTAERWSSLAQRGVVSRQENDINQSQYESQRSKVQSLEKAVNVARSNVNMARANLARLKDLQSYLKVRAPFAGVITLRNVDAGTLVTEGSTLMYRIAQTDRVRTYVNVPQSDAEAVHVGQLATLTIPDLPNKRFTGAVTRTANSLDPSTRTLLTEVQLANPGGQLMPGMYSQVDLTSPRKDPPLLIPGDTLVVRSDGPQVAVVGPGNMVHFQRIQLGRDYGDKLEVLSGLAAGQQIVVNPGDAVRENIKVNPELLRDKPARPAAAH